MDGDSDSLSEFRDFSPMKSPTTLNECSSSISFTLNGSSLDDSEITYRHSRQQINVNTENSYASINHQTPVQNQPFNETIKVETASVSKTQHQHIHQNGISETNDTKELVNGVDMSNGSQGSPLRSQLGLNLKKTHTQSSVKGKKTTSPNIVQCPLCPYTSENPVILEEHINRSHFDPLSPSINSPPNASYLDTLNAFACPICSRTFETTSDLELHVNIEHKDILSPATNVDCAAAAPIGSSRSICPVCGISLDRFNTHEMESHIESHFSKSPHKVEPDLEKQAQKLREQREFEMLRAQYGMDDQGNFREQSAAAMQSAVYAGEMSVADYYERQVGLRAAESHGIDDNTSCTKSVAPRVLSLSASSPGVIRSLVCSSVDHYASSYGDKGWGCGYRNLQV